MSAEMDALVAEVSQVKTVEASAVLALQGIQQREWTKLNPSEELQKQILNALEWQKELKDWKKDDGAFIPYATRYLKNKRWLDEPKRSWLEG